MSPFLALAANAWREQLRGRFFSVSLIFGAMLLYFSAILGILAADQASRVLLDLGLSSIELLCCAAAAYASATGIADEIEQKTIYLILTRPVGRGVYLLGRFTGTAAAALTSLLMMAALHAALLRFKGSHLGLDYGLALTGIGLKILLTAALSGLLTMIATSTLSALLMTGISWTAGHFIYEFRQIIETAHGAAAFILKPAVLLLPNFAVLNFRDRLSVPSALAPIPVADGVLYAAAYAALCLAASYGLFRRKEF